MTEFIFHPTYDGERGSIMKQNFPGSKPTPWQSALLGRRLPSSWRVLIALLVLLLTLTAAPVAYGQDEVHVVGRGENIASIAARYGVSVNTLITNNGLTNPNVIYVGQRLVVSDNGAATQATDTQTAAAEQLPAGDGYYTVRNGDSLSSIASQYGMSMADLMRLNGISNANFVWVGQNLRVSARVEAVAAEQTPNPQLAGDIYVVRAGDSLSSIAQDHGTTIQALLVANGLPNANFVWVGQRLRIQGTIGDTPIDDVATETTAAPADGVRWIDVNLTDQTLTAWQGDVIVMQTNISSGRSATPTVTGRFKVSSRYSSQRMTGPGYDLPDVPWVMYFFSNYAIHGAYWHDNWGTPMSHGCVNMRPGEAGMLYNWAPNGTEVYVHY